jgi:hypothetical protein
MVNSCRWRDSKSEFDEDNIQNPISSINNGIEEILLVSCIGHKGGITQRPG